MKNEKGAMTAGEGAFHLACSQSGVPLFEVVKSFHWFTLATLGAQLKHSVACGDLMLQVLPAGKGSSGYTAGLNHGSVVLW